MEKEGREQSREGRQYDGVIVLTLLASVVFFAVINELLRHYSNHYVILRKTSEWRLRNLAISWVHAVLCTFGYFYCYCAHGHRVQSFTDLFDVTPLPASLLVAFSVGYFTYDLLEHIRQGKALSLWEVSVHHIAVIAIFSYNLVYNFCVAFAVLALGVEVNSVFLHGRKLLQMCGVPFSHWLYRVTVALNLVTFVVCRGFALVMIWAGFARNVARCDWLYTVSLSVVMGFMTLLNPVLFWRLLKSDLLRGRNRKPAASDSPPCRSQDTNNGPSATVRRAAASDTTPRRPQDTEEGASARTRKALSDKSGTDGQSGGVRNDNGCVWREETKSHTIKDTRAATSVWKNGFTASHRVKSS